MRRTSTNNVSLVQIVKERDALGNGPPNFSSNHNPFEHLVLASTGDLSVGCTTPIMLGHVLDMNDDGAGQRAGIR